eukprot:4600386-Alexandrium_andersonii.AAC.1
MAPEQLDQVRGLLGSWWTSEEVPAEVLRARVVFIFEKGDRSNLANYRPISLLSSLYKIFAAMVKNRLEAEVEKHLQRT